MMASGLLDTLYRNITPIIVGKFYSTTDLGVYNRAHGYAELPSSQVHRVVMDVSFPVLSKVQDNDEKLIATYRKMIKVSTFIIFPLMMMLAALARPLIITLITAKWEACIILLQLMCFSMMWYPVHGLNLNILMVKGRTDLFLKLELAKKIVGLIVICGSLPFGLVAFCSAQIVSSYISLIINTWYTGKFYNFGFKEQIKDVFPTLLLSFIMFLCVLSLTTLFNNMILQIIIGFIMGTFLYLGGAYMMRYRELKDVKYLLSRQK
jgi:O-antigen/teichoic acid export membrane protein